MPKDVQIKVRNTNGVVGMPYTLIQAHFITMCHFQSPNCFILSHFEQFGWTVPILQYENEKYRFFLKKQKNKGGIWKWNTFLMTLTMYKKSLNRTET